MSTTDKIEHEVDIDASVAKVWELVTDPGWWVGDGDRSGQSRHREGEFEVIDDPKYGRFPVRVETMEPPHYISYRWASTAPGSMPAAGNSTKVEFWLAEREGGTRLRVIESGFAELAMSETERTAAAEDNAGGWKMQLDVLKAAAQNAA
ncbi:serine/threonine-protein kinase BRI1-like 1 [Nocardia panacis]|uniref:Serine/threonine-protein kinase BRI1-like 1 n=1 Tax=Nocardia panacis TaxID=2340916 RepID=A0A3A4KEX9_9NOCA|nr:SRPBCC domain-containing protein [Nocardia panacis]RJO72516.1 serine/threonine-protein kinase BRI1-like 1 [Nocardia panacis]